MASLDDEVTVVTSSMVVDVKSINLLESKSWNEILEAFSDTFLSVYDENDPRRPNWLDTKEELSHFARSLSSQPLSAHEVKAISSRICSEHSFNAACRLWASSETKWMLHYLSHSHSLMGGFMSIPSEVKRNPGVPAPEGHVSSGNSMRVAMVHTAILVLASLRRVSPIKLADPLPDSGFTVHVDGSVSRTEASTTNECAKSSLSSLSSENISK
jgi:hypothetical protein